MNIAFVFKTATKDYAPKVGMTVFIIDSGFTKHDANPSHFGVYFKPWTLATWGRTENGILQALLLGKARFDIDGYSINPMDVATMVPVCALKYDSHKSSYGTVDYNLLSPAEMLKRWKIKPQAQVGNDGMDVNVEKKLPAKKSSGKNKTKISGKKPKKNVTK